MCGEQTDHPQILYPVIYLSILAAGAVVELIPIQGELSSSDVMARMEQAGAKLIITDKRMLGLSQAASAPLPSVSVYVPEDDKSLFDPETPEYTGFTITSEAIAQDTPAFLNRTSGSTGGKLKTVITSHAHFIATLESTIHTIPSNTDPDADVWLSTLSLGFFINAKLNIGLNILLGIPCILTDEPFGVKNFDVIERHRITFLFIPPPVAAAVAGDDCSASVDVSSIKWLLSAGASMHQGLQRAVSAKLNNIHLDLEWGTTETLLIAIHREGHASPTGSSGTLVNGVEARVIDTETSEDLGPNESGEILVRHQACRYAGYKANDEANRATFDADGWFHSGDFGYLDARCNVYITDRIKELIRVGDGYGVHVSATDLEAVVFAHEAVARVVVIGVPDGKVGMDRPTAFVVLGAEWQGGAKQVQALESLRQWTGERLTGLKALSGGIVVLTEFPTIGFKINRRALKALAEVNKDSSGMKENWAVQHATKGSLMVETVIEVPQPSPIVA